jgi:ATP-dependent Clp protease protease subunit
MLKLFFSLVFLTACSSPAVPILTKAPVVQPVVMSVVEPESVPVAPISKLDYYTPIDNKTPLLELTSFDDSQVEGLLKKLKELDGKTKEIWIRINSQGGSVFGGQDLILGLEAAKSTIVCIADWKAYSMAFYTLQSQGCDWRLMSKRATLMAHEPAAGGQGNAGTLRDTADLLDALNEGFLVTCSERMGVPIETIRAKTQRKVWWMDYKTAEEWRAVDGWVDPSDMPNATPFTVKPGLLELLGL